MEFCIVFNFGLFSMGRIGTVPGIEGVEGTSTGYNVRVTTFSYNGLAIKYTSTWFLYVSVRVNLSVWRAGHDRVRVSSQDAVETVYAPLSKMSFDQIALLVALR